MTICRSRSHYSCKAFSKNPLSVFVPTKTKQNTFEQTSVFASFSAVHIKPFLFENVYFLIRFLQASILNHPKTLMEMTVYDAFLGTVFKSLRLQLSTLETEVPIFQPFSEASVFVSVFGHFSVNDR